MPLHVAEVILEFLKACRLCVRRPIMDICVLCLCPQLCNRRHCESRCMHGQHIGLSSTIVFLYFQHFRNCRPISFFSMVAFAYHWKRRVDKNCNRPSQYIDHTPISYYLKLDEAGAENWCSYVRKILSAANSHHYWTDQGSMTRSRLPVIKANLERIHITKCMENIANTDPRNKLRTYKKIKKEFSLEKYLLVVKNPKHRQA